MNRPKLRVPPYVTHPTPRALGNNGFTSTRATPDELTRRQWLVLICIAGGFQDKQIAEVLGITFETVQTHKKRMQYYLGTYSARSIDLVIAGEKHGYILKPTPLRQAYRDFFLGDSERLDPATPDEWERMVRRLPEEGA